MHARDFGSAGDRDGRAAARAEKLIARLNHLSR
jgi:hypothetical protein